MNEGKIFDMNISEPVSKNVSWYPIKQTMEYNNNNGHRNDESRFVLSFSAIHFETSRKGTSVVMSQPLRLITITGSDASGGARIEADREVFMNHHLSPLYALIAIVTQTPTWMIAWNTSHRHSSIIAEQLDTACEGADPTQGVKTGCTFSSCCIAELAKYSNRSVEF